MKRIQQFYEFMVERENIRLARVAGKPREKWTTDPILKAFKFTNVKRVHDRTTFTLVKDFYARHIDATLNVRLLNCAIFRLFGTVETAREIGWTEAWSAKRRERVRQTIKAMIAARRKVFTGAYIVPNCGEKKPKHEVVLDIMDRLAASLRERSADTYDHSWQELCEALQQVRGIGPFISKEVVLDYVLATSWTPNDWQTWTPVGPGARRGASRVVNGALGPMSEKNALAAIRVIHNRRGEFWPRKSVQLDLTDIQFQLCEFDKYERARLEEGRPKNRFKPTKT